MDQQEFRPSIKQCFDRWLARREDRESEPKKFVRECLVERFDESDIDEARFHDASYHLTRVLALAIRSKLQSSDDTLSHWRGNIYSLLDCIAEVIADDQFDGSVYTSGIKRACRVPPPPTQ